MYFLIVFSKNSSYLHTQILTNKGTFLLKEFGIIVKKRTDFAVLKLIYQVNEN